MYCTRNETVYASLILEHVKQGGEYLCCRTSHSLSYQGGGGWTTRSRCLRKPPGDIIVFSSTMRSFRESGKRDKSREIRFQRRQHSVSTSRSNTPPALKASSEGYSCRRREMLVAAL